MLRRISVITVLLVALSLQGCTTVYYKCATGDKAAREARKHMHILPALMSYSHSKGSSVEEVAEKSVKKWDGIFSSVEKEDQRKVSYEELSGEEYIIKLGESQAQLLKNIGQPLSKTLVDSKDHDERWEYEHFTVYFKKRHVKEVICKEKEGVFFSRESDYFLDFFPSFYYRGKSQRE